MFFIIAMNFHWSILNRERKTMINFCGLLAVSLHRRPIGDFPKFFISSHQRAIDFFFVLLVNTWKLCFLNIETIYIVSNFLVNVIVIFG